MNKTAATITILFALAACTADDIFADDAGDSETGGAFECLDPQTTSTPDGRTWGACDGWTAWAEIIDETEVIEAIVDGDWIETETTAGAHCYLISPDAIACTPEVGPWLLFTRPLEQLQPIHSVDDEACESLVGPWAWTWGDGARCRGVLDGNLVVRLLPVVD